MVIIVLKFRLQNQHREKWKFENVHVTAMNLKFVTVLCLTRRVLYGTNMFSMANISKYH
jgi:hypothetical protein